MWINGCTECEAPILCCSSCFPAPRQASRLLLPLPPPPPLHATENAEHCVEVPQSMPPGFHSSTTSLRECRAAQGPARVLRSLASRSSRPEDAPVWVDAWGHRPVPPCTLLLNGTFSFPTNSLPPNQANSYQSNSESSRVAGSAVVLSDAETRHRGRNPEGQTSLFAAHHGLLLHRGFTGQQL